MHNQAKKLQAVYYSRMADIAAIPAYEASYYRSLKEDLKNEILGWGDPPDMPEESFTPSKQMDPSAVETKNAMTAIFEAAKRVNGIR
jgi:hypothetical protein